MTKKIDFGKTPYSELHHVFKLSTHENLNKKKARLFPKGNIESETSTTSIFLASLSAVKEYREELLSTININKIKNKNIELHVFTEINNVTKEKRPDGLIVITSGKSNPIVEWAAFVEAKVKDSLIEEKQIHAYIDFAREIGINDIITISNQLVTSPFESPVTSPKRNFKLFHWSWAYLKVSAQRLIRTNVIKDEDHVFILTELRRYFDDHKNVSNFINMGQYWKESVNKIHSYDPNQKIDAKLLSNIVESYKQEEKDISLQLTDRSDFFIGLSNKGDRAQEIGKMLQKNKVINSTFLIDSDKNKSFHVDVDFIRQTVKCYTLVSIEKGKAQAQTTRLIKMLENESGTTDKIIINAFYIRNKTNCADTTLSSLIQQKVQSENYSILDKSKGDTVKYFEIRTVDLLGRDFQSSKNFILKLEDIALRFLTQIMANITK